MGREIEKSPSALSRRTFIRGGAVLTGASAVLLKASEAPAADGGPWPEYLIRREQDELFLRLTAVGYADPGAGYLRPVSTSSDLLLVFTLAPQHFAEKALDLHEIPLVLDENSLNKIALLASTPSRLVFRVPHRERVRLAPEEILAWHQFKLVLPDLDHAGQTYDLEIPDANLGVSTKVEMPWGINLAPVASGVHGSGFTFTDPIRLRAAGAWTELWTTALVGSESKGVQEPLPMEVLSVRGFERGASTGTVEQGNLVIKYENHSARAFPGEQTPVTDLDRVDIAASLSRRFPYTGRVGPPPVESGRILYVQENQCVSACFKPGRTIAASQLRLSARGGWLQLDGKWDPFPGCALSGWVHSTSLGRDHHVEVVREGFLYPFGTPCELVLISERIFAKDKDGHFVAPLIKQAFIQIPQPNSVAVGHAEGPFKTISITTRRSPPLDGPPDLYPKYDFFLPTVKGAPFAFEHLGADWNGDEHRAAMPMIFVSNKARLANGLIWEPGYTWTSTQANTPCAVLVSNSGDANHTIPPNGDGLRVVDKAWAAQPGRFARYDGSLMALAASMRRGDTSQKVSWIEWTRANVPDLNPTSIVTPPFRPRARTMRVSVQATGQLSGEPSASIVTYRDVRFTSTPILDPEPTTPPEFYFSNVTAQTRDPDVPYLYMLETRALVDQAGAAPARNDDQVAADIRNIYYGVSAPLNPIPTSLFAGIDNEIRFGRTGSAEGVGALSVPDTHSSTLRRGDGVLGDATFNDRRWPGYAVVKPKLEAAQRLDFAALSRTRRSKLDQAPFETSRTPTDRTNVTNAARTLMGYAAPRAPGMALVPAAAAPSPGLRLGDLFGADAEVLPGLRFADVFQDVALAGQPDASGENAASPLTWKVHLTGIEWLSEVLSADPATISLPEIISILKQDNTPNVGAKPLSMGMEATLNWSNTVFKKVEIGPVAFIPNDQTKLEIDATSRIDLGVVSIPDDASDIQFSPGKPRISAKAGFKSFSVQVFGAIQVDFSNVSFEMSADGHKDFKTVIDGVKLLPPLDFINQLESMFGGLGGDQGIHLSVAPERIEISQTLRFPSSGDTPLFIGPAQISNLSLSWSVTIPLTGRDVLAVGFGISSREKPLTIYVPPWYGGKAYALLENTTRGCRLAEISMEYGALVPITWGIATGQGSVTAGIFYMLQRDEARDSGSVVLSAFVKAAADLSVAGIIQFAGLVYIALTSQSGGGEKVLRGVVTVTVSIKIGFFRVSYSFSASHEEKQQTKESAALLANVGAPRLGHVMSVNEERAFLVARPRISGQPVDYVLPFAPPGFSSEYHDAFRRVLSGYRNG